MHVAQWEIAQGSAGDLDKARALLSRVAGSAAEESGEAAAKLRALDTAGEGEMVQT